MLTLPAVFAFDVGMAEFFLWHALAASGSADMWTLSIGGHHPRTELNATYNLTGPTRGLSGTHVNFETDGSPTRWDLYDPRSGDPDNVNSSSSSTTGRLALLTTRSITT